MTYFDQLTGEKYWRCEVCGSWEPWGIVTLNWKDYCASCYEREVLNHDKN